MQRRRRIHYFAFVAVAAVVMALIRFIHHSLIRFCSCHDTSTMMFSLRVSIFLSVSVRVVLFVLSLCGGKGRGGGEKEEREKGEYLDH